VKFINKIFLVSLSFILFIGIFSVNTDVKALAASTNDAALKAEQITGTEELVKADDKGIINNDIGAIKLPENNTDKINVNNGDNEQSSIGIGVPNEMNIGSPIVTNDGSYQYNGEHRNVDLVIQPTDVGVRSILSINNQNAPKRYDFKLDLPKGQKLVFSSDYFGKDLALEDDVEEVFVVDENNIIQSVFGEAWAKDANGNPVPTHYEIVDNSLIQVVDFNKDTAFPVLADPDWVAIGACSGALTWFVGSNLFAAAKIIKVKKYINSLGGFKETAKLITKATSWEEKLRVGGSALKSLAAEITGVAGLYACNKFIKKK